MIDTYIEQLRHGFSKIKDHRDDNTSYSLTDILTTGFAIFSLKDPSLCAFREEYPVRAENLQTIYGIETLPGDTCLRETIDYVQPKSLQDLFHIPLGILRNQGVFDKRTVLGGYTVVSVDGTGHYCSGKKDCPQCMVKNHKNGTQTFYHQLLGAVAVHPCESTVFPVACEAIVKQDGSTKNDCELNASKRIVPQIRKALPDEKIIAVFDALYANGPHVRCLGEHKMCYIIGTKGKTFVDIQAETLRQKGDLCAFSWENAQATCTATFFNKLVLNGENQDILTNYLEYKEVEKETGKQLFYSTWVTDIEITEDNVEELVMVARSRWKIENETFNTLKNQGYHLEHNYGHGKQYLATNFAILTFLAFLLDQMAQHLDENFQNAKAACKTFKSFWEKVRAVFYLCPALSMDAIYRFIVKREQLKMPALD